MADLSNRWVFGAANTIPANSADTLNLPSTFSNVSIFVRPT
jgi:hypothetical protein